MRQISTYILLTFLLFSCSKAKINEDFQKILDSKNITGVFVLYDYHKNMIITSNIKRANKMITPASTFKIAHSIIGLATKTVHSVNEIFFHYNGEKLYLKSWEKDMNLKQAIAVSNLVAYQVLARHIGHQKMLFNIKKLHYGNQEIGNTIDRFWLDGPLKISAIQQAVFLMKLEKKLLPYPKEILENVKNIILLEKNSNWKLYGKTGLLTSQKPNIGWFVGIVEENNNPYSFALNIDMNKNIPINERQRISKELLRNYGLLKK